MASGELEAPLDDSELFDRDAEALQLKSIMTGDIFTGVKIGDDEDQIVAIGGHPCAIRGSGGKLGPRVPCFIVKKADNPITYQQWPRAHFDRFPLSNNLGIGDDLEIRFTAWTTVHRRELKRERRVVTLLDRGIYIYLQRLTHSLTRCVFPLVEFEKGFKKFLDEAQMEYQWVADLVEQENPTEADIAALVKAFDAFLNEADKRRRMMLGQSGGLSVVVAEVNEHVELVLAEREGNESD